MDDVIVNKIGVIQKCIKRVHEEYDGYEKEIEDNYTKQDSIILNLQRACEASIDLATRIVRMKKLGIPQSSREVFVLLEKEGIITQDLSHSLQAMVGFRNIAVHDYTKVNLDIVRSIIKVRLCDIEKFTETVKSL